MNSIKRDLCAITLLLTAASALALGCEYQTRTECFTVEESIGHLIVDSGSGDVDVVGADTEVVRVEALIEGERTLVGRRVDGDQLTLWTDCDNEPWHCSIHYRIALPRGASADLETGSGDLRVSTLEGSVVLSTGSGDVDVHALSGAGLSADTGSGDITGRGLSTEEAYAETGSGDIDLSFDEAPGLVAVDTGSGDVYIDIPASDYQVATTTGSGDVTVDGVQVDQSSTRRISAESGSGDIDIRGR